jgi:hypothetical protein
VKNASEDRLTELADAAFRQAAKQVIKRAIDSGTKVIVWQDGKIKALDPRRLQIPAAKETVTPVKPRKTRNPKSGL